MPEKRLLAMEGLMSTLYIKNEAVADKARRLAKLTGQSITAAVSQALDESLEIFEPDKTTDRNQREHDQTKP